MIYRGYPQAFYWPYAAQNVVMAAQEVLDTQLEPYMVYRRENQTRWPMEWDDRRRLRAEYDYFRGLYPMAVRRCQQLVEAECDRIDGPACCMYDEYPDRETLYRMCDRIQRTAREQGFPDDRDMIHVLLLNEILKRRAFK